MHKRLKDLLRTLVPELRHVLLGRYDATGQPIRGDLDRELERLGVAPDGTITPLDALSNPTPADRRARRVAEAILAGLPAGERPAARREIVERAGYSWINRLIALRAMEARGLIDGTLRANPAYDGLSEALYILRQTQPERAAGADGGWWAVIEDACRAQAAALPGLFDLDDPNTALRPSTPALLSCVALVGGGLPGYTAEESDAAFRDPDAIGWAYQFYQDEAKARTYAKLNAGGKVETRAEIAAVTQLFTEPYMVKWLLQNSLGRTYHELYPDSRLPETWEYYIRSTEGAGISVGDRPFASLEDLTCMDPCMGGGHFLREEFDMLAAMYREQHPEMGAREVADRILGRHLHGIDIDPRAAQLAALTLYLRAWELVRDERRAQRLPGPGGYMPAALNLATTPTGLTSGALARHLERHPEDRVFEPLLRGVFSALEQAPILGSLLRPAEHLDEAIQAFRRQSKGQYGLFLEDQALNRLLEELGRHDVAELKRVLLERVTRSFVTDARSTGDVAAALFGREAGEGLRLLKLLERCYALVATNPPYMGSKNMDVELKQYVERHYASGKRDLFAAFILRCLAMCCTGGRTAMVTQQGWLFLSSYSELRAEPESDSSQGTEGQAFKGLLRETSLELLAHLGSHAFEEVGGEVVQAVLFSVRKARPRPTQKLVGLRLVGVASAQEKAAVLRDAAVNKADGLSHYVTQASLLHLPEFPIIYHLPPAFLAALSSPLNLRSVADVREGLHTTNNARFIRFHWEVPKSEDARWLPYEKGGGYGRWTGLRFYRVDWQYCGARVKNSPMAVVPSEDRYGLEGLTYSFMASGSLGVRDLPRGSLFDSASHAIHCVRTRREGLQAYLNSRIATFMLRSLAQSIRFNKGYVESIPVPPEEILRELAPWSRIAILLKSKLVELDPVEATFRPWDGTSSRAVERITMALGALMTLTEERIEKAVGRAFSLNTQDISTAYTDVGVPASSYPLVAAYGSLPSLGSITLAPHPEEDFESLLASSGHIEVSGESLGRIKSQLRAIYEAGPGWSGVRIDDAKLDESLCDDLVTLGGINPVPPETFVEEMSQKLQINPISVCWLLEELRAEGVRCKPEEQRILEDRLSVLVLRLLGHRWPREIEAGEPVPNWADADGVIPLMPGTGDPTLAERVRTRLRAEEGPLGLQQVEALLCELTNQDLDAWLKKSFFPRHVRQFKHRPIAWHLASTPQTAAGGRRKKANRTPAFECLVYYHACGGDVLARIRTHYVGTLLDAERRQADHARRTGDETAAAQAADRIYELEEFAERLRRVEEEGFSCTDLEERVKQEPLDRWSGDGVFPPASRAELLANERAWHVDINDGVRVNIAPLQQAGLLAAGVLNAKDVQKAIADRARWRSDERRWVREGVLPRCGWMDESAPESPAWTARALEREAERLRLEEKRAAVLARLQTGQE